MIKFEKNAPNPDPCIHNDNVFCCPTDRRCGCCGWNPEVEAKRLEKIRSGNQDQRISKNK